MLVHVANQLIPCSCSHNYCPRRLIFCCQIQLCRYLEFYRISRRKNGNRRVHNDMATIFIPSDFIHRRQVLWELRDTQALLPRKGAQFISRVFSRNLCLVMHKCSANVQMIVTVARNKIPGVSRMEQVFYIRARQQQCKQLGCFCLTIFSASIKKVIQVVSLSVVS